MIVAKMSRKNDEKKRFMYATDKFKKDVNEKVETMCRKEKLKCNVHNTGYAMKGIRNYDELSS